MRDKRLASPALKAHTPHPRQPIAESVGMPFREEDISAFGPDDLKILHDVFDLAWRRLLLGGLEVDGDQLAGARRRLARCIMANAKPGQLDVELLLERCVHLFNSGKPQ